jgi:membrane fusion protein, multidrug efflux system
MHVSRLSLIALFVGLVLGELLLGELPASAQAPSAGPPMVGVITVERQPITETTEFNGRIQSPDRVELVPRITAFLTERLFTEGDEVEAGKLLYRLERAPFQADVEAKQAAVAQAQAQLQNANQTLTRARDLITSAAGTQVAVDNAVAAQRTAVAQVQAAQAQLHQSEINLGYTEIHSPIKGRIGRTAVTVGNVVSPGTGALALVVSADPMYVVFPVAVRRVLELREYFATRGGFGAVKIRLRLPNGQMYNQTGKLDFLDIAVARETDTITLRGVIDNPVIQTIGSNKFHELTDGEFVTVALESVEPQRVLAVPRAAILADQQGNYVYVVNAQNTVEQRRVKLGQVTPEIAAITEGLQEGEKIVLEGIQRVRPNMVVAPTPAAPTTGAKRS